ncbi:carbon-nitrogen hydrolase [Colwellia sp. MSW7]|uniref:Carbon-nitrogen hydrolase n=1 Tax=Colwellia maritima TaxID=2912588 RepID=A0ABS9X689_9GAMM|nr:nitrilase-related carbon-nitrogen hydrolase [Colwellia maritima]MCI2285753.1 carbon-nitrogen hydrolase [Colwellia maritima]
MRVAVSQFATTANVQENLASCIRMINEASACNPSLIVLPEYCNTLFNNKLPSTDDNLTCDTSDCYIDNEQAWNEALSINGPFLQRIAEEAKKQHCYIVINVTLQREHKDFFSGETLDNTDKPNISVTSCLFSPLGQLIHQEDKRILTGYENKFFTPADKKTEVISTPLGKLGFLTGYDSMTFDVARSLALQGAQLLCNSINTCSLDQCGLHDHARACENNVFIACANKAGQSQILSPDGKVLAKLTNNKAGYTFADINLDTPDNKIGLSHKFRPDGTALIKQRRPTLYQALATAIKSSYNEKKIQSEFVPETVNLAIFSTYKSNEQAIEDVCHYIDNNLSDIIQLPELFFIADKKITHESMQLDEVENLSQQVITQVSAVLRPFQYVCTDLVIDGEHQAVLISKQGLLAKQPQLHFCQRYQWSPLGNDLTRVNIPLEQGSIDVVMLTADDANIPEMVKLAALKNIHLLLVPFDIQEPYEVEYGLLSRAAEHRICILAASREKSFTHSFSSHQQTAAHQTNKIKAQKSTGLIANLPKEFPLFSQIKTTKFNGYINYPLVKYQHGKITKAIIYPDAADNKLNLPLIYTLF